MNAETRPPLARDASPDPQYDGIDHINVYTRAQTHLGQGLSNLAHISLQHPTYGFFASIEALWYWAATGQQHEHLRRLYGASAKSAGIRLMRVEMDKEAFQNIIRDGLLLKVLQNPKLRDALIKSTLPFRHYFVYGNNPPVVREPKDHFWQMDCLEKIRLNLQEGNRLFLSDGSVANEKYTLPEIVENPTPEDLPPPVFHD